ncbi:MAG: tetratricopeptide repeat protein, partial [Sterolibacterium sp.]
MKEEKFELLASAEALAAALAAHNDGRLDLAETLYGRLLEDHPDYADAAQHFALLMHQRGHRQAAIDLIRRAIKLDAHRPEWHNDLGNMLAADQQLEPARTAFIAAIELDPGRAEVWNNLGAILQRQQHLDEADFSYRQALALNPEFVDAMSNLGNLLAVRGLAAESAEYLCRAFVTAADDATPKDLLGIAYNLLGRQDEAKEVYRRWLHEAPAHPIAGHLYAACSGVDVPLRASNAYIEMYFDDLAKSFDAKLLDNLDYRAPRLVGRMLAQHASLERTMIGLDAGCGTGLCGAQISPYVERLTGIDLSSKMLAQAKQKRVYDELVKTELTQFMHAHPAAFDLIVMADTLIYFGPL